jgi:hypothetical protein
MAADETEYTFSEKTGIYFLTAGVVGVFFFVASIIVLFAASVLMFIITGNGLKNIIDMPFKVGGLAFVLAFILPFVLRMIDKQLG